MNRDELIEHQLARFPLFAGLSPKEIGRVASLLTRLELPAETVLAHEGERGYEFILVVEGEIEVRHDGNVVATRGPGEFVGEIALLSERPRTATLIAKGAVILEVLGRGEFATLLADFPDLADAIRAASTERLADLERRPQDN